MFPPCTGLVKDVWYIGHGSTKPHCEQLRSLCHKLNRAADQTVVIATPLIETKFARVPSAMALASRASPTPGGLEVPRAKREPCIVALRELRRRSCDGYMCCCRRPTIY